VEEYIPEHDPSLDDMEDDMAAWRLAFERKPYSVKCKTCSAPDLDSEQNLREKGWALSGDGEFCPSH
jgi:hypothetical protein